MYLLWSLIAYKTYSSQQYWNTSLSQPTSFLLFSLISWGFLCFVQFWFFGVFLARQAVLRKYLHVSFSFFHDILITRTKILCILSNFFLFSLSRGLFYRTFQWEMLSQVLRHLKYCLKYQFPFNKWSTKRWLTYRPDRVWKATDFGCKCVWDGLIPYCWLVSLEDFAVVFFPSHQMHVHWSNLLLSHWRDADFHRNSFSWLLREVKDIILVLNSFFSLLKKLVPYPLGHQCRL